MNVEQLFDRVIVYNGSLTFTERKEIAEDIVFRTLNLPLQRPFTKDELMEKFDDRNIILYLHDIYTLYAIDFFIGRNRFP